MSFRALFVLLMAGALACAPEPASAPVDAEQPVVASQRYDDLADVDRDNLLNIASGAAVVSRTAEMDLEASALHAIDGMHTTRWATPTGGGSQTMVFSLGAPSRIERLGVLAYLRPNEVPEQIRFEASLDGTSWTDVLALQPKQKNEPQVVAVSPFDARYLRVGTVVPPPKRSTHITSIQAFGREIAAPGTPLFDGCWTINSQPSRIVLNGARLTGVIGGGQPTYLDGSVEGRVGRVMWMRGHVWGYAVLTVSADGGAISGATFFKNPRIVHGGPAWIGERCSTAVNFTPLSPEVFLGKAGHWTVDEASAPAIAQFLAARPGQRYRVTAYESREKTPEENRRRADARLASLRAALQQYGADLSRVELIAAGKQLEETERYFAVQRILWSRMDLALLR
ncbi:MAG TPA: discoidin domain-containing protein [Thermoanaerobaculia bacterium]|nr:discoidin domain-containing protein [Thermoanaerobaculia bacterium]